MRIEASAVIHRPIGEVFSFATDTDKIAMWAGPVTEAKQTSEGPVGVGTTSTHVTQMLGRKFESNYEVTDYQPNTSYSAKTTSGPVPIEEHLSFETVEGGTKVTVAGELNAAGFFKLAEPILGRIIKRQVGHDVAMLKELLEADM